jgi:4-hydroxybenzoate polyprenyltransferase
MEAPPSRLAIYLRLGRISNLPTVWTNAWTGAILGGAAVDAALGLVLAVALSAFYVGGMFLNDAFDWRFDQQVRPERPIPRGLISVAEVYAVGLGLLAVGLALLAAASALADGAMAAALAAGAVLAALIVYYNWRHKGDPFSPLVMALCRAMSYVAAAAAGGTALAAQVLWGACALTAWVIGLSYVAKQENLREVRNLWPLAFLAGPLLYGVSAAPGGPYVLSAGAFILAWAVYAVSYLVRGEGRDIPRAVVSLIAGISLVDALILLVAGAPAGWAIGCVLAFALTLALQRFVPGT